MEKYQPMSPIRALGHIITIILLYRSERLELSIRWYYIIPSRSVITVVLYYRKVPIYSPDRTQRPIPMY